MSLSQKAAMPPLSSPVFLLASLAFLPLSATMAPRAMVFLPGLIALGFLGAAWIRERQAPLPSRTLWAFVLAPVALGAVSALWSVDPAQALERAAKVAAALATGALLIPIVQSITQQNLSRFLWILPVAVVVSALIPALDLALGLPLHRLAAGVEAGAPFDPFHVNRGVVVCALLFFPALGLARMIPDKRSKNSLTAALVLSCAALLFLCESQSAQLGFCCGLLALGLFTIVRRRAGRWAFLALLGGFIISAPWLAQSAFAPLSAAIEARESLREMSAPQRLEIWDFVARRALEKPAFGFGIEATRDMVFETAQMYHKGNTVLHPHDFALQIWIEFGALGVACALVFFGALTCRIAALPDHAGRFAFAGFSAALSIAATGYGMWQGWWLGTLMALTAWSVLLRAAAGAKEV